MKIPTPKDTSPYNLMQEEFRDQPWRLLVCCILLNQTSAKQARPVWEQLFQRWPTPEKFFFKSASPEILSEMVEMVRPLGFQNRRIERIRRMTIDFLNLRPDLNEEIDISSLYGIGKYGSDSYNIFCRGYLVLDVQDKELKNYVNWATDKPERACEDLREIAFEPSPSGQVSETRR